MLKMVGTAIILSLASTGTLNFDYCEVNSHQNIAILEPSNDTQTIIISSLNDKIIFLDSECDHNILMNKKISILNFLLEDDENNENEIINMFKQDIDENNNNSFFDYLFKNETDTNKLKLLSILLSSDIPIINNWYKSALNVCKNSQNKLLSIKAKNIYELYSKEFEKF